MEIILGETNPTDPPAPILDAEDERLFIIRVVATVVTTALAFPLCFALLGKKGANKTFFNRLYGNLLLAIILSELLLRPGTILRSTVHRQSLSTEYCALTFFVLELQTIMLPMMMLMLAIERVIFIGDRCCAKDDETNKYWSILTTPKQIVMMILPWFIGFIIGSIKAFVLLQTIVSDETISSDTNSTLPVAEMLKGGVDAKKHPLCGMTWRSEEARIVSEVFLFTFRSCFPVVYLTIALAYLGYCWRIYFYLFHPQKNNIYKAYGKVVAQDKNDQNANHTGERETLTNTHGYHWERAENPDLDDSYELPSKPTGSFIITSCLCFMTVCVTIGSVPLTRTRGWLDGNTQWLFFMIETVAVILPYMLFPEIRKIIIAPFCCLCKKRGKKDLTASPQPTQPECEIMAYRPNHSAPETRTIEV